MNIPRFWRQYGQVFDRLNDDKSDIRAIVLSSSLPKIFTAGLDRKHTSHDSGQNFSSAFVPRKLWRLSP
jgi:enoyl-CoA hydratase/carnithine racemase